MFSGIFFLMLLLSRHCNFLQRTTSFHQNSIHVQCFTLTELHSSYEYRYKLHSSIFTLQMNSIQTVKIEPEPTWWNAFTAWRRAH